MGLCQTAMSSSVVLSHNSLHWHVVASLGYTCISNVLRTPKILLHAISAPTLPTCPVRSLRSNNDVSKRCRTWLSMNEWNFVWRRIGCQPMTCCQSADEAVVNFWILKIMNIFIIVAINRSTHTLHCPCSFNWSSIRRCQDQDDLTEFANSTHLHAKTSVDQWLLRWSCDLWLLWQYNKALYAWCNPTVM